MNDSKDLINIRRTNIMKPYIHDFINRTIYYLHSARNVASTVAFR